MSKAVGFIMKTFKIYAYVFYCFYEHDLVEHLVEKVLQLLSLKTVESSFAVNVDNHFQTELSHQI